MESQMTESIVYKGSAGEYERRQKEVENDPRLKKASEEWLTQAKAIEGKKDDAYKSLNAEWAESFKPGGDDKALAYHERSEAIERDYQGTLTELKRKLFSKYGLGDIPVSDYEYRLYLEYKDPRTSKLDKLKVRRAGAYRDFEKSLAGEITRAGGAKNLSYDKEGELGKFSARTQKLYKKYKRLDKDISDVKRDYPSEDQRKKTVQSIKSSRSPLSQSSDERQEHSLVLEPDDPRVEKWKRDPGMADVRGIDTPKKHHKKRTKRDNPTTLGSIR